MTTLTIKLTEDILRLISNIRFKEVPEAAKDDYEKEKRDFIIYAIDYASVYGGSFVFEDISYILGRYDEHIPGTEEEPTGVRFNQEFEDYMWSIHMYIMENIDAIEELVHQFSIKGGLKPGIYQCKSNFRMWEYKGEDKK